MGGDVVFEERRAEGGADAAGFEEVLVGDGQTVQRAERFAARLHLVGACGGFGGHLGDQGDDGVDLGIDAIDLLEVLGERFAGGELLCSNELGHLDCAGETKRGGRGLGFKRAAMGKREAAAIPIRTSRRVGLSGIMWTDFIIGPFLTSKPRALSNFA